MIRLAPSWRPTAKFVVRLHSKVPACDRQKPLQLINKRANVSSRGLELFLLRFHAKFQLDHFVRTVQNVLVAREDASIFCVRK